MDRCRRRSNETSVREACQQLQADRNDRPTPAARAIRPTGRETADAAATWHRYTDLADDLTRELGPGALDTVADEEEPKP